MIKKSKKTTRLFKEIMIYKDIVSRNGINFTGAKMMFPYTWNGERLFAVIELKDIIESIKWDIKM